MKLAVFYYTQSGQAFDVAMKLTLPFEETPACTVAFKEIRPLHSFPFPWTRREFFDAFPESRLGLPPCGIAPIYLQDVRDAELVIVVGQSWFLSPSLPLQAFFLDSEVRSFLQGRKVIFVNACRNMWLMTLLKVRGYLDDAGAELVGHIVLQDETSNLVSVATVVRWLLYGKKKRSWMLPRAGVSKAHIVASARFADTIKRAMLADDYHALQEQLVGAGAIHYKPAVLFLERLGHRMFGLWAPFIRRKGDFGDPRRECRCTLFMIYLLVVLYLVSPIGTLVFWLTYPFRHVARHKQADCIAFGRGRSLR